MFGAVVSDCCSVMVRVLETGSLTLPAVSVEYAVKLLVVLCESGETNDQSVCPAGSESEPTTVPLL